MAETIQAWAAVAASALALVLAVLNVFYLRQNRRIVLAMEHSNELAEENLARVARSEAARIEVLPRGGTLGEEEWLFHYTLLNRGRGHAHDVAVQFGLEYQQILDRSIPPDNRTEVYLRVPFERIPRNPQPEPPKVSSLTFSDSIGDWWLQPGNPSGRLRAPEPIREE